MMCLMMVDRVRMAPLSKSSSLQLDESKFPAALLFPPGLKRYEASVCINRIMLHALYQMPVLICAATKSRSW